MRRYLTAVWVTMALLGMMSGCGGDDDGDADVGQTGAGQTEAAETETDDAETGDAETGDVPDDDSAGSGTDVQAIRDDPCSLVTQEEATGYLGKPTSAPEAGRAVGAVEATCSYSVETDRPSEVESATVSLMFTPERVEGESDGASFMDSAREGVEAEELTGLGDEAFCIAPGLVFARVGDVVLNTGANSCDQAAQFATAAISRL